MSSIIQNQNPILYEKCRERMFTVEDLNDDITDCFDTREIFDIIKIIKDPEHPLSLEELHVVEEKLITLENESNKLLVQFTPTIPHCSMALLIGLSIRVQLLRSLPSRFKVTVEVSPGTHVNANEINKQLADKERVAAALENDSLIKVINQCIVCDEEE